MKVKQLLTTTVDLQEPFNSKIQSPLYARYGSHLTSQLTVLREQQQRQSDARNFPDMFAFIISDDLLKGLLDGLGGLLCSVSTWLQQPDRLLRSKV